MYPEHLFLWFNNYGRCIEKCRGEQAFLSEHVTLRWKRTDGGFHSLLACLNGTASTSIIITHASLYLSFTIDIIDVIDWLSVCLVDIGLPITIMIYMVIAVTMHVD